MDAAAALPGREALLGGVHIVHHAGDRPEQVVAGRVGHLRQERQGLLGFPFLGRLVGDGAQRLAGEAAADHRIGLAHRQNGVLVGLAGMGLIRCDEARAHPHADTAERQRRRQPAAIEQPAGRHHRHVHGIHHLRPQCHRGHRAGVPAGLGTLCDHHVAAGFRRLDGVAHIAGHAHHHHAGLLELVDNRHRHAQPGDERLGAALDDHIDAGRQRFRLRGQQIDAERLVRQVPHPCHLLADLVRRHPRHAQRAEAASLAHRRAHLGIGHTAHAGEENGMLDAEQVTDLGMDGHLQAFGGIRQSGSEGAAQRPWVMKTR